MQLQTVSTLQADGVGLLTVFVDVGKMVAQNFTQSFKLGVTLVTLAKAKCLLRSILEEQGSVILRAESYIAVVRVSTYVV